MTHNSKYTKGVNQGMAKKEVDSKRGGQDKVPLTLRERQSVVRELARKYLRAPRKEKGRILDQLAQLTGYNRSYAARALRAAAQPAWKRKQTPKKKGGRKPVYGHDVICALTRVWAILDGPCGKRLAPFLPEIVPILERFGELRLDHQVRQKLTSMSASTIDRLLAPTRKKLTLKPRSGTKPGTLLKGEIPVKTFADWQDSEPGFLEIDLVAHDGGSPSGDYAQTLDAVDVATGWTETMAVKNKAQKWVFQALEEIIHRCPFPVKGIDSDNGAEFINAHLMRYCAQHQITFTRSRPYKKNDSCHVEQKNWSVVRRTVGYGRYDTEEEVSVLNQLYQLLRLYTNYFQPVRKLQHKERNGAKVKKSYDVAKTPYQRVLLAPQVSDEVKARLQAEYSTLNPAELKRQIARLKAKLVELRRAKSSQSARPSPGKEQAAS